MNTNKPSIGRNPAFSKPGIFLLILLSSFLVFSCCCKKCDPEPADIPKSNLKLPAKVLFYYSWPSVINASNSDINMAVSVFKQFEIVILGDGLQKTTHPDHLRTKSIISELIKSGVKVFGYIDVGSSQNLSAAQLKLATDDWKAMAVTGVFGDEFDSQYKVNRSRQNEFINYAHQLGMSVFANGFLIDEILGGDDCKLGKGDYYLLESFGYGHGSYFPLSQTIERGQKAYKYKENLGVGIITVASVGLKDPIQADADKSAPFLHSYSATALFNFDGFAFSDQGYSANVEGVNANRAYLYNHPAPFYGNKFIAGEFAKKVSDTEYTTTTDTHIIRLTEKGGSITKK